MSADAPAVREERVYQQSMPLVRRTAPWRHDPGAWLRLSVAAALMAAAGNVWSLLHVDRVYGAETDAFVNQAVAQDMVDLVIVAPLLVVSAVVALRGSLRAYLVWLGALTFTIYNYVIYTIAIHFGPLFLLWVAVLGGSLYAFVGGVVSVDARVVASRFHGRAGRPVGWFLVVVAAAFAVLWLSEIVPALADGTVPKGAADLNLPTNPVHVLDLAFFLPAVAAVGVAMLRRRPFGYPLAPAALLFLALTGLPILVTPFVADARGDAAQWAVLAPISLVTASCFGLLAWLMAGWRRSPVI